MEPSPGPVASWRGWDERSGDGPQTVTSARLGASAKPRSRLFPKTRSWFALDAPLELLSPLSVARVLVALAVVSWPVVGLTAPLPPWCRIGIAIVSALTAATWAGLMAVHAIGLAASRGLVAYWTVAVAFLVLFGHGTSAVAVFVVFLVPASVFAALFLGRRTVATQQAASLVTLWLALAPTSGVGRGLLVAATWTAALCLAPVAVVFLARSARRHDIVDPDTGLPNGYGLARQLEEQSAVCFLVGVVALDGIGDAREAFGYQVGSELLRRAVEDLGQVLPTDAVIGRVTGDELVVTVGIPAQVALDADERLEPGPDRVNGLPAPIAEVGRSLAETLVGAIAAGRYQVGSTEVPLRAHVGLSGAPWDSTSVAELVRRASISARRAADSGVPLVLWDGDRGALTAADLGLLGDLRQAAGRGELTLAYQPQMASDGTGIRSVEALLRWDSPTHGARLARPVHPSGRAHRIDRRAHRVGGRRGPGCSVPMAR